MMKKLAISISVIIIAVLTFSFVNEFQYRRIPNTSYDRGEKLTFRGHYGFINAGWGEILISKKLYKVNDRICYKVETKGRSSKSFDWFVRIRNTWRTYIDTSAIIPQKFYRHIEEGKYRKTEEVFYNHENNTARIVDKKRKINKTYKIPANAQDLISGFFYLRNIDLTNIKINDTIFIPGFLENEVLNVKLVYKGKGKVKTKLGKFRALKFIPIVKENSLFDGEESIRVWISDDKNRVPLKLEADMFVGSVKMDLEKATGLKYKLNRI